MIKDPVSFEYGSESRHQLIRTNLKLVEPLLLNRDLNYEFYNDSNHKLITTDLKQVEYVLGMIP